MKYLIIIAALFFSSCHAPTAWEKATFESLKAQGAPIIETYEPGTAAILNILPGFGDLYTEEYGAFAFNLLLWPWSIIWGMPEAGLTAQNKNMKDTVYFYMAGPGRGKYEIPIEPLIITAK